MGVNHLWSILEPVKRKENLSALSSKTLCVDLSGWVCEAQCAKGLKQNVSKPHLRNLFFRLLHLTRLGVKLVFVVDGKPPELKWNAIAKRVQARNGGQSTWRGKNPAKAGSGARVGRSHFAVWVRECCTLLNLLGVPCIESAGEAEALCAWLDLHQIVDGCITNDGDAFLYGARTVYKDLCISGKDASVECYKMEKIETELNLNRQKLVALGILLGCDYLPQGVPGIGKEISMRLMKNVHQGNLIDRFYEWKKGTELDENVSSVEKSVKCKALKDKNFPHPEVIQEYLTPKVVPQRVSLKISNPDLPGLQEFCLKHLEWPEEYTRDKVLLLITYWQMTSSLLHSTLTLVQPERIVKARIQQKIECYEVEWQNVQLGETCPTFFVTIETRELFAKVYPELVEEFNDREAAKLSKKSKKKQAAKLPSVSDDYENEVEFLSKQLEDLSVHQSSEQSHSGMVQNENHFAAGTISDISDDESLQDIIDSILPLDINGHSSLGLEKSTPAKKNDVKSKFSAVAIGGLRSDNDDDENNVFSDNDEDGGIDDNNDDDLNSDEIYWDLKSSQTDILGCSLYHNKESEIKEKSQKLKSSSLKGVEGINTDDYYYYHHNRKNHNADNDKPTEWPLTLLERKRLEELKPVLCSESQSVVKPRDKNEGHRENPTCTQRQNEKPSKTKLSDAELIEIFGSSDEEGDEKSFTMKQTSLSTKLKGDTRKHVAKRSSTVSRNKLQNVFDSSERVTFLHTPLQHTNMGFPYEADCTNVIAGNGRGVTTKSKGYLESLLQDASCAKSNVSSLIRDANFEKDAKGKMKEQSKALRKVLEPANTILNNTSQHSMQAFDSHKKENCESSRTCSHESSGNFQECKSLKENTASPFDDYLLTPLLKRLCAKKRLASLHSVSSVTDDS